VFTKNRRDVKADRSLSSFEVTGKSVSEPSAESRIAGIDNGPMHEATAVKQADTTAVLLAGGLLAAVFLWSYWPTLAHLVSRWNAVADYSHGFLVAPLAIGFLWFRRDRFPRDARGIGWGALLVLGLGLAVRISSARFFLPAFDGWSIPFWLGGVCVLFGGWKLLRWCLPSLAFLVFMVPLPYRMEGALSVPMRYLATKLSCMCLQCFGQPALQEGTTIVIDEQTLEIVRECSGLRMLMGIAALATAYVIVTRKPWWQKALLLCSVAPVAISANVLRITLTGVLLQYLSGEALRTFIHDVAGWLTNILAAVLFAVVLWCMSRLFVEVETIGESELLRAEPNT